MADRVLRVVMVGDERDLERGFKRASVGASRLNNDFSKLSRGALVGSGALGRFGRAATFASGAFLGGAGITALLTQSSEAASNLAEQTSKASVVFGRSSTVVQRFARDSLALATDQALAAAAAFGALLRPLGITEKAAAVTSDRLVQLAVDLSSFSNTPLPDALQAIQSGLVGEIEPLRRYGILLSEARVQQEALKETGKTHVKTLTSQEKVQARLTLIFRDSAQAQGDFARTQGGLANQQRILAGNIRDVEGAIGQALNPAILDATKSLNAWLGDSKNQERVQRDLTEAVRVGSQVVRDFGAVAQTAADAVGGFKNLVELLLALKVASVLAGWVGSFKTLGTAAGEEGAAGRVGLLLGRMTALKTLGPVTAIIALKIVADKAGINTDFSPGNLLSTLNPFKNKGPGLNFLLGKGFQSDAERRAKAAGKKIGKSMADGVSDPNNFINIVDSLIPEVNRQSQKISKGATAAQKNTWFDALIGRREDRVQDIATLRGQVAEVDRIIASIQREINRVQDPTRRATLTDELVKEQRDRKNILAQIAQNTIDAARDASQKITDALNLGLSRAQVTAAFSDDLKALRAIETNLQSRIKSEGRAADLMQQLFDTQQQIIDVQKRADAARQFRTLGLGPTGDTLVPGITALKKELNRLGTGVEGTFLDTKKTTSVFANIRKVLSGNLGKVGEDVRTKIASILGDLDRQLKDHATQVTRRHFDSSAILAGLGLSPDQIREARFRLAAISPGGTVPRRTQAFALAGGGQTIIMHSPQFHGVTDVNALEEQLRRRNLQRARARRGPYAGRN